MCDLWCYSLFDCNSQIIIGWHHPAIMHWSTTDVYRTGSQLVYPSVIAMHWSTTLLTLKWFYWVFFRVFVPTETMPNWWHHGIKLVNALKAIASICIRHNPITSIEVWYRSSNQVLKASAVHVEQNYSLDGSTACQVIFTVTWGWTELG